MKSVFGITVAWCTAQVQAVKILMAGNFDSNGRTFFNEMADAVATNPDYDNTVYLMSTDLAPMQTEKVSDRLYKYGVGKERVFEHHCQELEFDDYQRIDRETAQMYFGDQAMLADLKKQGFELGIGGLNYADSLLFRHLGIEYLKVTEEDLESFTLQAKLKVPILTSTYPSSQVWSRFDYSALPHFGSLSYRLPFFGLYQKNKWDYNSHMTEMKKIVGANNAHLVTDFDQDHGMFIGQGTRAGLFQSIMMKPPNVRYVYPLTGARSEVQVNSGFKNAVVVFNLESDNHGQDRMCCPGNRAKLIDEIKHVSGTGVGVVVLAPPSIKEDLEGALSKDV